MPKTECKCITCGKIFYAYIYEPKHTGKYCSLACAYKSSAYVWNKGKKGLQIAWNKGLTSDSNMPNFDQSMLKISEAKTGKERPDMFGENNLAKRPEVRVKISETKLGDLNPSKRLDVRQKISIANKGKKRTLEFKMKISAIHKGKITSPETRKKMAEVWKNDDYKNRMIRSIMLSCGKKPNKAEQKLDILLQGLFPNEYKYVGSGQFVLGGKCPDFMNINGKKKVIELFGDYWHKGEDPNNIIDHYKKYGFDCLVIWENELHNLENLPQEITQFTER